MREHYGVSRARRRARRNALWGEFANRGTRMRLNRTCAALGLLALLGSAPAQAWPFDQPPDPLQAARATGDLPSDADPYYSTPGVTDRDVDFQTDHAQGGRRSHPRAAGHGDDQHAAERGFSCRCRGARRSNIASPSAARASPGRAGRRSAARPIWPGWTPPPEMLERDSSPARTCRRRPVEPARRARALSVPGPQGHLVPHPRHQ